MDSLSSEIKNFFEINGLGEPPFSRHQYENLEHYLDLLVKWNKKINLVSDGEIPQLHVHILDSLILYPFLECNEILDMGSGGGFPAIPLAITSPGTKFTLVESRSRKASFLQQVAITLKLNNLKIINARIETLEIITPCITARAFQPPAELLYTSFPFLEKSGKIYSHLSSKQEIPADSRYTVEKVFSYMLPGVKKKRRIVIFKKNG